MARKNLRHVSVKNAKNIMGPDCMSLWWLIDPDIDADRWPNKRDCHDVSEPYEDVVRRLTLQAMVENGS